MSKQCLRQPLAFAPLCIVDLLARIPNEFSTTLMPLCYSFFPSELSSVVGFHKPWSQGEGIITQQKIKQCQAGPPSHRGSGGRPLRCHSLSCLLWLNVCASDNNHPSTGICVESALTSANRSVLSRQGGCYSILFLVCEGSMTWHGGFVAFF